MIGIFVFGFLWGCTIGVIVTFWIGSRYARDLHERLVRLENRAEEPSQATLNRIESNVMRHIAHLTCEDDDDVSPLTRH